MHKWHRSPLQLTPHVEHYELYGAGWPNKCVWVGHVPHVKYGSSWVSFGKICFPVSCDWPQNSSWPCLTQWLLRKRASNAEKLPVEPVWTLRCFGIIQISISISDTVQSQIRPPLFSYAIGRKFRNHTGYRIRCAGVFWFTFQSKGFCQYRLEGPIPTRLFLKQFWKKYRKYLKFFLIKTAYNAF